MLYNCLEWYNVRFCLHVCGYRSVSVGLGTSMSVDFDDRDREIQDTAAAMLELADTLPPAVAARRSSGNPSIYTSRAYASPSICDGSALAHYS